MSELISEGDITPNTGQIFEVMFVADHKTLKVHDRVVMAESPEIDNVFIRIRDLTLHALQSSHGYVILRHSKDAEEGKTI